MNAFWITAKYIKPEDRQIRDTERVITWIIEGKKRHITIAEAIHVANELNAAVGEANRDDSLGRSLAAGIGPGVVGSTSDDDWHGGQK